MEVSSSPRLHSSFETVEYLDGSNRVPCGSTHTTTSPPFARRKQVPHAHEGEQVEHFVDVNTVILVLAIRSCFAVRTWKAHCESATLVFSMLGAWHRWLGLVFGLASGLQCLPLRHYSLHTAKVQRDLGPRATGVAIAIEVWVGIDISPSRNGSVSRPGRIYRQPVEDHCNVRLEFFTFLGVAAQKSGQLHEDGVFGSTRRNLPTYTLPTQ